MEKKVILFSRVILNKWLDLNIRNNVDTIYRNLISTIDEIDVGVPQGSFLGPLLFLLHINGLSERIICGCPILFTNIVSVIVKARTVNAIFNDKIEKTMTKVIDWVQ